MTDSLDDPEALRRLRTRCRRYGLTVDEFLAMWEEQGGRCAICRGGLSLRSVRIDHYHDAERDGPEFRAALVRGLLCNACNSYLPQVEFEPAESLDRHLRWLTVQIEDAHRRLDLYRRARPLYLKAVRGYLEGGGTHHDDGEDAELLALGRGVPWRHEDWAGPGLDIGGAIMEFTDRPPAD